MARAHAANACAQSDSIKGLAQSIAKPAYTRLLTAEPTLRRAVPTLIIAFLITICLGAFVQVLDQSRQTARADFQALRDSRRQLRTLMQQPNSDPAAIQTAATQVKTLQDKLFDQRLQTQLAIRAKLTPEQWQRWLELRQGMGNRWMRHGRGAGMGAGKGTM